MKAPVKDVNDHTSSIKEMKKTRDCYETKCLVPANEAIVVKF